MHTLQIIEATNAGVGRHVLDLSEHLVEMGDELTLVYSKRRAENHILERIQALARSPQVRTMEVDLRRGPHPSDWSAWQRLKKELKLRRSVEIIHGHSTKGGAIARMLGRSLRLPVIYTPNAVRSMDPQLKRLPKRFVIAIEAFLSRYTAHTIAVSPEELRHLQAEIGIAPEKVSVVPNGINPMELPTRDAARKELGLAQDAWYVGFVGRLGWQKGPDLLLEAIPEILKQAPHLRFAIIGRGDMEGALQQRARELKVDHALEWLGFRNGARAMPAFDAFVLPSRYEGLPYVLIEALAAGLPIVASDQTGCELVVQSHRNGFVYPFLDRAGLTQSIVELARNPQLCLEFRTQALELATQFTARKMAESTRRIYESQLQRPGS